MTKSNKARLNQSVTTQETSLSESQLEVVAAVTAAIAALRRVARDFVDPAVTSVQEVQEIFEKAAMEASNKLGQASLLRFLSIDNDPAWCVRAFLREMASLGHPPTGTDLATGKRGPLFGEDFLVPLAERIEEIDFLDFEDRLNLYINEHDRGAAIAVGIHLARFGDNDILADTPWSHNEVRNCQAAAAITAAALSRLAASKEPGADDFRGLTENSIAHSDAVAATAYHAYVTEGNSVLTGFGAASQVVEELLYAADLDELESTDLHRLSGQLASAFVTAVDGEDFVHDEDEEQAIALLTAAYEAGLAIHEAEESYEQGHEDDGSETHSASPETAFGRASGGHLIN